MEFVDDLGCACLRQQQCVQKRYEPLEKIDRLDLRLAIFEHVMSVECLAYRERKKRTRPRLSRPRGSARRWGSEMGTICYDTTSTEEEAGEPPAAVNMSIEDADATMSLTTITTPASPSRICHYPRGIQTPT